MSEITEKFVKILAKLDKYYILRHEEHHLIIGTEVEFLEHKPEIEQIFTTYRPTPIQKKLSVFFLVSNAPKPLELDKFFLKKNLPLLSLNKYKNKLTIKDIETLLEEFVTNNFKY